MAETKKVAAKKAPVKKAPVKKASPKAKEVVVDVKKAAPAKQKAPAKTAPKSKEAKPKALKAVSKTEKAKVEVKPITAPKVETVKVEVKEETKVAPKKVVKSPVEAKSVNRLKEKYIKIVRGHLIEKFHYSSLMETPSLEKVVINIGVGDAVANSKALDDSVRELGQITGQHPVVTKAKKSIASFKLRQGQAIGCKVTLRGTRMYEFFDKLVSIALPRVRDFRGVNKNAFDGHGNYTLGIKEQVIFPEIDYDKVNKFRGMDIVIVTTAKTDEEAFTLLKELGMPFHK